MPNKILKGRIQNKHDTFVNWEKATNFIPLEGEVIVYDDGIGNNLKNFEEYASSRAKCENFRQTGALSASWNCAAGRCPTWPRLEAALSRELSNGYFCRPLKNNLRKSWKICVPLELKKQILGE